MIYLKNLIIAIWSTITLLYRYIFNKVKYNTYILLPNEEQPLKINISKEKPDKFKIGDKLYNVVLITDEIINPTLVYRWIMLEE